MFLGSNNPARISDFGGNPIPSRKASGKLFWNARIYFGLPKTQLAMFA
mgnify:FL=1